MTETEAQFQQLFSSLDSAIKRLEKLKEGDTSTEAKIKALADQFRKRSENFRHYAKTKCENERYWTGKEAEAIFITQKLEKLLNEHPNQQP